MQEPEQDRFDDLDTLKTIVRAARLWWADDNGRVVKCIEVIPVPGRSAWLKHYISVDSIEYWECALAGDWTYTGDLDPVIRWWEGQGLTEVKLQAGRRYGELKLRALPDAGAGTSPMEFRLRVPNPGSQ